MSKGKIIILCIGLIIIVAAIIALMVADVQDTTVLTIGKDKYPLSDFESYVKDWFYEDNTNITNSFDDMLSQYESYKTYYKWAVKAGVTLEETEKPVAPDSGEVARMLSDYDLTLDEYLRVQEEITLGTKLFSNSAELAKCPENTTESYISYLNTYPEAVSNSYGITMNNGESIDDYLKTVDYRVFEIMLPEVSGDFSGDESGEQAAKREVTLNAKLKAQDLMADIQAKLASGDTMDDIVATLDPEISLVTRMGVNSQNLTNGEKETISLLNEKATFYNAMYYIQLYQMYGLETRSASLFENLDRVIFDLEKGEFSDIFETEDSVAFVYVEDAREGLEGDELTEFQNDAANFYISANTDKVANKIVAKKFDYEKLPGVIAKRKAEAEAAAAAASGDSLVIDDSAVDETPVDETPVDEAPVVEVAE